MNETNHISDTELLQFHHNLMNQSETKKFLEHISSCDFCADRFAALMSEEIIPAPRDLKANIMAATRKPEVQLAVRMRDTSKRMQLFIYGLKVGTATLGALLLLLLSMNFSNISSINDSSDITTTQVVANTENVPLTSKIRANLDKFSNNMLVFSNNIIKTEVSDHDQKEK